MLFMKSGEKDKEKIDPPKLPSTTTTKQNPANVPLKNPGNTVPRTSVTLAPARTVLDRLSADSKRMQMHTCGGDR